MWIRPFKAPALLDFFDDRIYYQLRDHVRNDPNIAAIGAALIEQKLL